MLFFSAVSRFCLCFLRGYAILREGRAVTLYRFGFPFFTGKVVKRTDAGDAAVSGRETVQKLRKGFYGRERI